jgi:uncharacterized repeat protein (TIGR03803 family)
MIRFHMLTRIVAALAAVAVAGCSGGGGSTSGPLPQTAAPLSSLSDQQVNGDALAVDAAKQPPAVTYQSLFSFNRTAGAGPTSGALIDVNGTLYGTTLVGGTSNMGTVFEMSTSGKDESVLYSFKSGTDGSEPQAGLIYVNGTLYGTTVVGGTSNMGTVFAVSTSGTGTDSVLHSFGSGTDGATPTSALIDVNGALYGTTLYGGTSNMGTVFEMSTSGTGTYSVLHSFVGSGADGAGPDAPGGLIDVNGTLYGTTVRGGANGLGTVFEMSTSGKDESVLYSFKGGTDGAAPTAGLIDVNRTLYGTTLYGGTSNMGTVFEMSTSGKDESVLYSFKGGTDGANPYADLIDVNGALYGTTSGGGANGSGTFFEVSRSGKESVLHTFGSGTDGALPTAGLIDVNGTLYGTTQNGGVSSNGTVFKVSL